MAKICKDHKGNEFNSIHEMCEYWGVPYKTFNGRFYKLKWSLQDCLEAGNDVGKRNYVCKDHLGNTYESKVKMCEHWGIDYQVFSQRIHRGWTLQRALETSMCIKDHLGNEFKGIPAMCKHWGVTRGIFNKRQRQGYSLQECLEGRIIKVYTDTQGTEYGYVYDNNRIMCKDHKGNKYKNIDKMCEYYGLNRYTFNTRLARGWSLKDALETQANKFVCVDHNGRVFANILEMCKFYNIGIHAFRARLARGWSLKDALETQVSNFICVDHNGRVFANTQEMCKFYNIGVCAFRSRLTRGYTLQEALETPVRKHTGRSKI